MQKLVILECRAVMRLARGGRLLPWLGPALRGLIGGRLKARACRQPVAEQLERFERCAGCPHMQGCAFGQTYEPDPPAGLHLASGWENTARPIVIAPEFPAPESGKPGLTVHVTTTFIGQAAAAHSEEYWEAFRLSGADLAIGLGDDHILFDLERGTAAAEPCEATLPLEPTDEPPIPCVRVELTAPLILNESVGAQRRQLVVRPTFGQLVRAGLRVLGPLHKLYAAPLPESVFARVKEASEQVPMLDYLFRNFQQTKWSNRTKDRFEVSGIVGWAEFGPVPAWLLPWISWAGRLHVGTHRVAGAGGWNVVHEGLT